jgi:hypothetical protein
MTASRNCSVSTPPRRSGGWTDALTPNLAAGKNKKAAALSRQPGSIQNTDMSFCLA